MDANICKFEPQKEIHVLVVDVDEVSRKSLEQTLLSCNYQVTVTDDVKKARHLLTNRKNNKFDIAMIDAYQFISDRFYFTEMTTNMEIFTILSIYAKDIPATRDDVLLKAARCCRADLFMIKPVGLDTAKYLWQHLLPRKYMILPEEEPMNSNIVTFDPHREQIHILVVDADLVSRSSLEEVLLSCNYKVTVAESANRASTLLKKENNDFDIAIVDVHQHETEGLDFIEKAAEMKIFTVHISAGELLEDGTLVEEGQSHGANLFLMKPVRLGTAMYLWQHLSKMNNSTHTMSGT